MIPRHLQITAGLLLVAVFAMAVYALRLKHKVEEVPARTADLVRVTPPVAGPTEHVTLFIAYDDEGVLRATPEDIPLPVERSARARELLQALCLKYQERPSPHPLGAGADVKEVYLAEGGTAVVDLNSAFADSHRSGILAEELTVISLIKTLSANMPEVTQVKLLVEGKERETLAGHADLGTFYGVAEINQLLKQLQ